MFLNVAEPREEVQRILRGRYRDTQIDEGGPFKAPGEPPRFDKNIIGSPLYPGKPEVYPIDLALHYR
jgi:hypothetical protein